MFEAQRHRHYLRELMFLVILDLQHSLHAAVRKKEHLPMWLAALDNKVKRTELPLLRALVQGGSARLQPISAALDVGACKPGWQVPIAGSHDRPGSCRWFTTPTWRRWSNCWPARMLTKAKVAL